MGWASGFAGGLLALAGGLSLGAWRNHSQQQQVVTTAEQKRDFVPGLRVATVTPSPRNTSVTLPGTTAAFADANIYARASGYIARRNVDIGDHVKVGGAAGGDRPCRNSMTRSRRTSRPSPNSSLRCTSGGQPKLAEVTWDRDRPLVHEGWATQQQGTVDIQTVKRTRPRSPSPTKCRRSGGPAQAAPSEQGLRLGRRAVRRRHHSAQHRRRQPGAGRRDERHLHVRDHAERRDPLWVYVPQERHSASPGR